MSWIHRRFGGGRNLEVRDAGGWAGVNDPVAEVYGIHALPERVMLRSSSLRDAVAIWMQACRVKSLAISSIGVMVGAAVAFDDHAYHPVRLLLAWLGAVAIQAGTNLINVSYNYKGRGGPFQADPKGSSAVVRAGLLSAEEVRRGGMVCFGVGIVCGILLTWMCGWIMLLIGIPAVLVGYSYAGPPLRLGYRGLGVATVFAFMGPVMVVGSYFVMTLHVSAGALAASVPIGLLAAGVMHTNDLRDYASDVVHGKRTLATLLGRTGANYALAAMDVATYGAVAVAAVAGWLPWLVLLGFVTVPVALRQVRLVFRENSAEELNRAWFQAVQLHMQFGLCMIVGLAIRGVLRR